MALFSEYAVTPDVFNEALYESPNLWNSYFSQLRDVFVSQGIVRDLRNGDWYDLLRKTIVSQRSIKLLTDLKEKNRLVPSDPALDYKPQNDRDWCDEALASNEKTSRENLPLHGIIVSEVIRKTYKNNPLVESVNRLSISDYQWWSPGDNSNPIQLKRNIDAYKKTLMLILRRAKSMMFIDPYINPTHTRYESLIQLLEAVGERADKPYIEIHCSIKSWGNIESMKDIFQKKFKPVLKNCEKIEIFVWGKDDFHDRWLISNLGGISMSNGFDTHPTELATWTRLRPDIRDNIQREFDPSTYAKTLQNKFLISSNRDLLQNAK